MKPDNMFKFVQELKRRRVFRGIIVYGASVLVLFEAASNLAQTFGRESAPPWVVIVLGAFFFVSLWFSWVYDITPGGIRKTAPESKEQVPIPKKEVRTYQTTTFVSVLLIIGLVAYNIFDNAQAKPIRALEKTIAVLPYNNPSLTPSKGRTYEFIGQELTSNLWKIEDYKTLPWDECRAYMRRNKSFSQIGEELRVCILILWRPYETEENQHLSIELISAKNADLIWSKTYAIKGPWADEVRRLSGKITKKINRKLRTYPGPEERALLGEESVSAQASLYAFLGDTYTKDAWTNARTGADNEKQSALTDSISFSIAVKYYTDAINEDPNFAEAYANRAKAKLMGIRAHFYDNTVLDEAREDIEKASRINEDLPEVHVARGFYYFYGIKEYELAALSFEKACELRPNYTEYQFYLSKIFSTLGNWRQVLVLTDKVFESNSQNALYYTNLGLAYQNLNEFTKADQSQDRAIELLPQWYAPYINKAHCQVFRGEIAEARTTIVEGIENSGKRFNRFLAELYLYEGNFVNAAQQIEFATDQEFKDLQESKGEAFLIKAKIYKHAGRTDLATENYKHAAAFYEEILKTNPDNHYAHSKLGLAFAGLNNEQRAMEHGKKALILGTKNFSATAFPFILYDVALTYTIIGEYKSALDTLRDLMAIHSLFTLDYLKIDPDLKALQNEPGFKDLNP
jgi:tetratricopeptide (TPR) repeat protein